MFIFLLLFFVNTTNVNQNRHFISKIILTRYTKHDVSVITVELHLSEKGGKRKCISILSMMTEIGQVISISFK